MPELENNNSERLAKLEELAREESVKDSYSSNAPIPNAKVTPEVKKKDEEDDGLIDSLILDLATSRPIESIEDMETKVPKEEYIVPDKRIDDAGFRELLNNNEIKYLDLSHCYYITDFSPLRNHKSLIQLSLSENKIIEDASFLSELENLKVLDLGGTHVSDISFVKNFKKLQILNIRYAPVSDISALAYLEDLRDFIFIGCEKIRDFSLLAKNKELRLLDAQEASGLTDISFVKELPKIQTLYFDFCPIKDMEPIRHAYSLKCFSFECIGAQIPKIENYFSELENLQYLNLKKNKIFTLEPFRKLTKMVILNVAFNNFTDVSPIRDMTEIRRLYLNENPGVQDISSLTNFPNLELIDLSGVRVRDISALSTYKKMKRLDMNNNIVISDLSPLTPLKNLAEVYINKNYKVSDLSPLRNKEKMRILRCNNISIISDISPMKRKTGIAEIAMQSTNVPCFQIPELKNSLSMAVLSVYRSSDEFVKLRYVHNVRRKLIQLREAEDF